MNIQDVLRGIRFHAKRHPEPYNSWADEIERLKDAVQERDGVIEVTLLRELRLREALAEADRSLEQAAQLNPAVMAAHAAIRAALAGKEKQQ